MIADAAEHRLNRIARTLGVSRATLLLRAFNEGPSDPPALDGTPDEIEAYAGQLADPIKRTRLLRIVRSLRQEA